MEASEVPQVNIAHYTYRVTWSVGDGEYVATCLEAEGDGESAGAYQAMGCPVYSSAVFNFIPRTTMTFYDAHAAGDRAQAGHRRPCRERAGRAGTTHVDLLGLRRRRVGRQDPSRPLRPLGNVGREDDSHR